MHRNNEATIRPLNSVRSLTKVIIRNGPNNAFPLATDRSKSERRGFQDSIRQIGEANGNRKALGME